MVNNIQDSRKEQATNLKENRANNSAAQFFDAALRPELWPCILQQHLKETGQTAAALSGQGRTALTGPFFSWGLDEERVAIFMRDYANPQDNLALDVFDKAPLGIATAWSKLVPPETWDEISIARDLVFPMGLEWKYAVNLFWDGEYGALLSVLGPPEGYPVEHAALDQATQICRYLAPAFEMTCRIAIAERENQSLWSAFATLGLGLVIQNHAGRVTRMNATAEAILGGTDRPLRLAAPKETLAVGGVAKDVVLLTSGVEGPVLALRLPMQPSQIGRWNDAGSFLVILLELDRDAPQIWQILRNVFGATPRQVEVAKFLLDGETSHDIAANLGISANTVDTHIDRLCLQTGTANRTMLRNWMMQLRSIV